MPIFSQILEIKIKAYLPTNFSETNYGKQDFFYGASRLSSEVKRLTQPISPGGFYCIFPRCYFSVVIIYTFIIFTYKDYYTAYFICLFLIDNIF